MQEVAISIDSVSSGVSVPSLREVERKSIIARARRFLESRVDAWGLISGGRWNESGNPTMTAFRVEWELQVLSKVNLKYWMGQKNFIRKAGYLVYKKMPEAVYFTIANISPSFSRTGLVLDCLNFLDIFATASSVKMMTLEACIALCHL